MNLRWIALGGALGAACRMAVGALLGDAGGAFVWGTFLVNVPGAFGLGWFLAHADRTDRDDRIVAGVGTGFFGALTTFSTFAVEVVEGAGAEPGLALGYLGASIVLGLVAAAAGLRLGGGMRS